MVHAGAARTVEEVAHAFHRAALHHRRRNAKNAVASLKTLEEDGIVCRKAYPEIPPRVEYSLTSRGTEMLKAMQPLTDWAIRNMEAILRDRESRQRQGVANLNNK